MSTEVAILQVNNTEVYAQGDYLFPQAMAEAMGLDWNAQRQRIERSSWSEGWTCTAHVQVPGDTQARSRFAMHQRYVPMWIAGIDTRHMNPDVKPVVEAWQREIAEVLAEHYYPTKNDGRFKAGNTSGTNARYRNGLPTDDFLVKAQAMGLRKVPSKYGDFEFDSSAVQFAVSLVRGVIKADFIEEAADLQTRIDAGNELSRKLGYQINGKLPPPPVLGGSTYRGTPEQDGDSPYV